MRTPFFIFYVFGFDGNGFEFAGSEQTSPNTVPNHFCALTLPLAFLLLTFFAFDFFAFEFAGPFPFIFPFASGFVFAFSVSSLRLRLRFW